MDILFHWLIPLIIVIAFSNIDKRTILLLSPFALFPEIDAFFVMHRILLHNIFVALVPLLFYFISRKNKLIFVLISYFLLSHLILDLAYPGVALFYPLSGKCLYFSIDFMFDDYRISPVIHYGIEYIEVGAPRGEFISNLAVMVLILVLLFAAAQLLLKKEKKQGITGS
ncbi:MAG: hypothetical protein A7316_02045 [Candidatus Altiarchaeales archaeon WOR_SM1_86-2]|nr:MAG: hypothetical protein A7316_02045 [Candidatus Altiarchaeales archaeon WOR_SM1_86-2]ODS41571.1 MAG: hypothetical protein A7315_01400 [Candidatus Altiarchaeales archaeon WOR_SM1_79]